MRWKTTLALLISAIGLGSYVALYEIKQPTSEERQGLARQIVNIPPDTVRAVMIEFPDTKAAIERKEGSWRLVSPLAARAEESLLRRILDELSPLESLRALEGSKEKSLALGQYGLEAPKGSLTVIAGSQAPKLVFGEATAVGGNRYVKLADSAKVFVISGGLFEALNQPLESYRSHELLAFDTQEASKIAVASPNSSYTLIRQSGRWQLSQPIADEADGAASSTILSKLRNLRIEEFVSDESRVEQLPEWGFETPYAHLTIALSESKQPLELFVGKPTTRNPDHLYAKRTDENAIYAVRKLSIDELLQDPQSLRSRACFDFFASQVVRFHVAWKGSTFRVEKSNGQWKLAEDQTLLDSQKVEEWLWKLRDMKLTRFVEDEPQDVGSFGLSPPGATIQVWLDQDQEPKQLLIGDTIEQGQARYGRIAGRSSVVELPSTINELLTTTPESFAPTQPEQPSPAPTQ